MEQFNFVVNNFNITIGEKPNYSKLRKAEFRKVGFLRKLTTSALKGDTVWRNGDGIIEFFQGNLKLVPILSGPSYCTNVTDIYIYNNLIYKIVFTLRSKKVTIEELPSVAKFLFGEFINKGAIYLGEPPINLEKWGFVWDQSSSLVKAGLLENENQFFIIWEIQPSPIRV